jgi:hypothetical protein
MSDDTDLGWAELLDAADDRKEELSDALTALVEAVLEEGRIPANRVKDVDYIYDTLGSQVGSAVNHALAVLRGAL